VTIANQNVVMHRGDSKTLFVELTNADGTPFNPAAGAEIRYSIAFNASEVGAPLIFKELGNGIVPATVDDKTGVNITLTPADTNLFPRQYYHELKVEDQGDVTTAMVGVILVKPALQPWTLAEMEAAATGSMTTTATVS
jgi:hypothetical protein